MLKKVLSVLLALAIAATMSAFAMTASAETNVKWELPVDDIDAWVGENMSPYNWNQPLAEGCDTIEAEVTSEGMALSFPANDSTMTYPNARVENPGGFLQITEDDYINIKASLGNAGDTDIRWTVSLKFVAGSANLRYTMAELAGVELFGGSQLPAGDYDLSFNIADAIKATDEAEGTQIYDGIWGEGGNTYITGVVFYIYSEGRVTDKPLVVKSITVGDKASDNAGTESKAPATDDTSKAPADKNESTTSNASSKGQVSTGESVMPIVGIAALAVVATSAVVISRKKK